MTKNLFCLSFLLTNAVLSQAQTTTGANTKLSNLVSPTAVNVDLLPSSTNTRNLGSRTYGWKSLYLTGGGYIGGRLFLHNKGVDNTFLGDSAGAAVTTGVENTALGVNALYKNATGSFNTASGAFTLYKNTTGSSNTAIGRFALGGNSTGKQNTAVGMQALYLNTSGNYNIAIGFNALFSNQGDYNTASGYQALLKNETGIVNTANGANALYSNRNGNDNTATGVNALYYNTAGGKNTANGLQALWRNTAGTGNTAIGWGALSSNQTGNNNTAVGTNADVIGNLSNATAIGYDALVTTSNSVCIGNYGVTSIGGQVNWTAFSDGRYKRNIKQNVVGLEFIKSLKPITYSVDVYGLNAYYRKGKKETEGAAGDEKFSAALKESEEKASNVIYNGFIAQEVEEAAKKLNYEFSGVDRPQSKDGLYGLRYSDFAVPLVKAVQELDATNKDKDAKIITLQEEVNELKERLNKLEALIGHNNNNGGNGTFNLSSAYLQQNTPNPSNSTTTIRYHLSSNVTNAKLLIIDIKGAVVKTVFLNKGSSQVIINTNTLAAGTYIYSLWVNNKQVDSKQMLVSR